MKIAAYGLPDQARLLGADARRTPEMEALWQWIVADDAKDSDTGRDLDPQQARALVARLAKRWNVNLPGMASVERLSLPGLAGAPPIAADMIVPHQARVGCILYAHGGGWAFGDLDTHQRTMRMLAQATQTRVLGIDYRLAPEHPYPAPLEDVLAGWRWLVAQSGTDAGKAAGLAGPLAMAGDSAGASLAISAIMRENELQRPIPEAALLFYGIYSADLDSPSYQRFSTGHGLTPEAMQRYFDWYVPGSTPDSPRFDTIVNQVAAGEAVLARLPPLFLNAAGLDVLLCDTLAFAERLRRVGVPHELVVHEGVHHGFVQYSARLEEARRAFALAGEFYRRVLG